MSLDDDAPYCTFDDEHPEPDQPDEEEYWLCDWCGDAGCHRCDPEHDTHDPYNDYDDCYDDLGGSD